MRNALQLKFDRLTVLCVYNASFILSWGWKKETRYRVCDIMNRVIYALSLWHSISDSQSKRLLN